MYLGQQTINISIGDKYELRGVHDLEIKKSIHQILQTAKVELPISAVIKNQDINTYIKLADKINEGDKIKLEFGYNGKNNLEFEGYVRRMNFKSPLVLECEDELYLLRKVILKKSFLSSTLKEVISYLLDELSKQQGLKIEMYSYMPELTISNFQMKEKSGVVVLQELKDRCLLSIFLTVINGKKTLYVGLLYGLQKDTVKYVFNKNTVSIDNLKFNRSKEKKYLATIINIDTRGNKLTIKTGDKDGEPITILTNGDHTQQDLEHKAQAELQNYSNGGYSGTLDAFLFPYIEPGVIANLIDEQYEDRTGNYYIGTVTTTFGINGGRRKSEIDLKVS